MVIALGQMNKKGSKNEHSGSLASVASLSLRSLTSLDLQVFPTRNQNASMVSILMFDAYQGDKKHD